MTSEAKPFFERTPSFSRVRIKGRSSTPTEWSPAVPKRGHAYLLASGRNGTLYVGVTSDLVRRVWKHHQHLVEGFTKRYGVDRLVYYEVHGSMEKAVRREKRLKRWHRSWKLELIEEVNPTWRDLYEELEGIPTLGLR